MPLLVPTDRFAVVNEILTVHLYKYKTFQVPGLEKLGFLRKKFLGY